MLQLFLPITEKWLALDHSHIFQQHWMLVLHYWNDCCSDTQTSTAFFTTHNMDWKRAVTAKSCYWSSDCRLSVQAVKSTASSTQRVPLAAASSHLVPFNHAYWRLGSIFLPMCGPHWGRPHSGSINNNWIIYFIKMYSESFLNVLQHLVTTAF